MEFFTISLVISLNLAIALAGFYLAWRIWHLKRSLSSATVILTVWERDIQQALNPQGVSSVMERGRQATIASRKHYRHLQQQLRHLRQAMAIAKVSVQIVRRLNRRIR